MILFNMANTLKQFIFFVSCIYKFGSYLQRHTFSLFYFKLSIRTYGFFIDEVLPKGNRVDNYLWLKLRLLPL